ncbi:MAG: CNNM domain-containing protein, partial [Pirellulales bacterium]|nr:CNNM domain-containing protein [Pirellulales bacterium]
MIVLAIGVSLFLCLSGVMAAVDAAILSVTHPEIEELVHQRRFGANRLRDAKRRLAHSVVVIVVITNTINVLGPILIGHHAFGLFDRDGILLIMAGLTIGTIVFSEILPKAIGNRYAPTIARWSAHPLMVVQAVLYPLVALFAWMSKRLTPGKRKIGTEPQIRSLVRIGHAAGHIETDEENLIQRVFLLNDRTAADIMTPLSEVHALSIRSNIEQAAAE